MEHAWFSRFVTVVLVGGLCLVGSGLGITSAAAAPPVKEDALAGVTQNWDKNLPSASRFTVLSAFGGAAVRDNNTGLVWEHAPDVTTHTWGLVTTYCANKTVGGTNGWRVPSLIELRSVQDPSLPPPFVPTNIFSGIQQGTYWSATAFAPVPVVAPLAWVVDFFNSFVSFARQTDEHIAWCVRGPMNADTY